MLHGPAGQQALQRGPRLGVLGIDIEDVLVRLDRFGHVPQRHFQDLSQPKSELDDLIVGVRQTNLATNNVR